MTEHVRIGFIGICRREDPTNTVPRSLRKQYDRVTLGCAELMVNAVQAEDPADFTRQWRSKRDAQPLGGKGFDV